MRIALMVTSNNEHCNGGCEFALLDLTAELAALALRRITALREQKDLDPDIDETYYWAYFVECYFDPWGPSRRLATRKSKPLVSRWGTCLMSFRSKRRK